MTDADLTPWERHNRAKNERKRKRDRERQSKHRTRTVTNDFVDFPKEARTARRFGGPGWRTGSRPFVPDDAYNAWGKTQGHGDC